MMLITRRFFSSTVGGSRLSSSSSIVNDNNNNITNSETLNHDEFTAAKNEEEAKKKNDRKRADEDDDIKDSILDASLKFVPEMGWSDKAVKAGTESLGYPSVTAGIIEKPDIELVHHHYVNSNLKLEESMVKQREDLNKEGLSLKIPSFIRNNVEDRLRMNIPYIKKWPEAIAIMSHPANYPHQSLIYGLELMDSIWHYAGDKSVDYNWYTKRLSLGLIYKSTEMVMIQDNSQDFAETWKFLDRRLKDHKDLSSILNDIGDIPQTLNGVGITLKNIMGLNK